jgi:hypothetical protein
MKTALLLISLLFLLSACEPPGKGEKAERGYAEGARLIKALDAFKQNNGRYPEQLGELVPKYLDAVPDASKTGSNSLRFWYAPKGDSYRITFNYRGPGSNNCIYEPSMRKSWVCGGGY